MTDINEKIKNIIDSNEIVLFMKGTPNAPQCGFSLDFSNILKHLKVNFEGVNILERELMTMNLITQITQRNFLNA